MHLQMGHAARGMRGGKLVTLTNHRADVTRFIQRTGASGAEKPQKSQQFFEFPDQRFARRAEKEDRVERARGLGCDLLLDASAH